jgi:ubiquitin
LNRVKGAAKLGLEQQAQKERQENDLRNPACLGQLHSIRSLSPHKPRAT